MGILAPNRWGRRAQTPDPWAIDRIGAGMTIQNPTGDDSPRARVGRPPSCLCGTCTKCVRRVRSRERYRAMSVEERRDLIARRDKDKVRAADRARYRRDWEKRNALRDELVAANVAKAQLAKSEWTDRNPEKRRAQNAIGNAVRDGRIQRLPCEQCGAEKAQAHHDDYSKPLDVRWLCAWCHAQHHVKEREIQRRGNGGA